MGHFVLGFAAFIVLWFVWKLFRYCKYQLICLPGLLCPNKIICATLPKPLSAIFKFGVDCCCQSAEEKQMQYKEASVNSICFVCFAERFFLLNHLKKCYNQSFLQKCSIVCNCKCLKLQQN